VDHIVQQTRAAGIHRILSFPVGQNQILPTPIFADFLQGKYLRTGGFTSQLLWMYIACCLVMGLAPKPSQDDHFAQDPVFANKWLQQRISGRKWRAMHSALKYDTEFIEKKLNFRFQQYWTPFPFVAVDEGIIPFKGRYRFRQHIRNKPKATGIKFYAMSDNKGFLCSFFTYHGTQPNTVKLVLGLTKKLPRVGYHVYADCYYGSDTLARFLQKHGHYFTLSCQSNRPSWLFADYLAVGLQKHQWNWSCHPKRGLCALSFHDRGMCHFISNQYGGKDWELTAKGEIIPVMVGDYRRHYGAVDTSDSNHLLYLYKHRNLKRTMAQFQSYVKMAVANAWVYYKTGHTQEISQKDFIRVLVEEMWPVADRIPEIYPTIENAHLIQRGPKKSVCSYCKGPKRSTTPYFCASCNIPLHADCFFAAHSQ
jgi:hypothetical protein